MRKTNRCDTDNCVKTTIFPRRIALSIGGFGADTRNTSLRTILAVGNGLTGHRLSLKPLPTADSTFSLIIPPNASVDLFGAIIVHLINDSAIINATSIPWGDQLNITPDSPDQSGADLPGSTRPFLQGTPQAKDGLRPGTLSRIREKALGDFSTPLSRPKRQLKRETTKGL